MQGVCYPSLLQQNVCDHTQTAIELEMWKQLWFMHDKAPILLTHDTELSLYSQYADWRIQQEESVL